MKVLIMFSNRFKYTPTKKTLDNFPDFNKENEIKESLVAFIHAEEKDQDDMKSVEKKLVKLLKWAGKKNNTRKITLHSFAHLSESKATPEWTKDLFDMAEKRLQNADYETQQTPFGYFLDLDLQAPGYSAARIFKSF